MLLDIPIKECNVDGHINILNKRSGCLPQSASFRVIELDFLTYLLIDAKPWSFMQEVKVFHAALIPLPMLDMINHA